MNKFDLTIVGNGMIALVTAYKAIKKMPNLKITIIGKFDKPFSASVGAGAMHATYCEIEDTFHHSERDQEAYRVGLAARNGWRNLIQELNIPDAIICEDSLLYSRINGTIFERSNFEMACAIAEKDGCIGDISENEKKLYFCGNLQPKDVIAKRFIGEFSLDIPLIFKTLEEILTKKQVHFINSEALKIISTSDCAVCKLVNDEDVYSEKILIAAGSNSSQLVPENFKTIPIYHGIGTALIYNSCPDTYKDLNFVIRTPNRGGAQCGMHIVPRSEGKYYLGAGNYFSKSRTSHRAETIRYLIDSCEEELFGKETTYKVQADLLIGARPKSLDGYPVVGTNKNYSNIFIASGTYRLGVSWSPVIADEVISWIDHQSPVVNYPNWLPNRKPISYGTINTAIKYYTESRISNLIEHKIFSLSDYDKIEEKKEELSKFVKSTNQSIVDKHGFPNDFVVDPDMYQFLLE